MLIELAALLCMFDDLKLCDLDASFYLHSYSDNTYISGHIDTLDICVDYLILEGGQSHAKRQEFPHMEIIGEILYTTGRK